MSYRCKLDNQEIADEYEHICKDWGYWNPWHPPDREDPLFRECCRSCKHADYKGGKRGKTEK